MTPAPRTLRVLDALSLLALIGAVLVALWPTRVSVPASAPIASELAMPHMPQTEVDSNSDAAIVVAANIMSGSRHAPASRYTSPDAQVAEAYVPPAAFARAAGATPIAGDSSADVEPVPGLYGIINMGGTWRALMRLSGADVNPTLLKEGDKRGQYRVVSILRDRVLIAGPSGQQRTLRLSSASRTDSTGHKL